MSETMIAVLKVAGDTAACNGIKNKCRKMIKDDGERYPRN